MRAGVLQQVVQDLAEAVQVDVDDHLLVDDDGGDVTRPDPDDLADRLAQRHGLHGQPQLPQGSAGGIQGVVGQASQPIDLGEDPAQRLRADLGLVVGIGHQVGPAADHRQRRAQLVGDQPQVPVAVQHSGVDAVPGGDGVRRHPGEHGQHCPRARVATGVRRRGLRRGVRALDDLPHRIP